MSFHGLSSHSKGYLCGIGAVLVGSPTFVIVRVLKHSTAWTQLALRTPPFLFVCLCVALRTRTVRELLSTIVHVGPRGWLASFCVAAQSVAIVCALLLTSASNVAIIINTAPVFCALADGFVLKETVPCRTVAMICGGLVGVAFIVGGDLSASRGSQHNTGNLIALVNPISWACYWCILRATGSTPVEQKVTPSAQTDTDCTAVVGDCANTDAEAGVAAGVDAGARAHALRAGNSNSKQDNIIAYQLISGTFVGLAGLVGGADVRTVRKGPFLDIGMYIVYGGVILPLCLQLFSLAPTFISTAEMGAIKMLETVLCPLLAWLYDGDSPSSNTYVGGAIVVCSICAHSVAAMRARSPALKQAGDSTTRTNAVVHSSASAKVTV